MQCFSIAHQECSSQFEIVRCTLWVYASECARETDSHTHTERHRENIQEAYILWMYNNQWRARWTPHCFMFMVLLHSGRLWIFRHSNSDNTRTSTMWARVTETATHRKRLHRKAAFIFLQIIPRSESFFLTNIYCWLLTTEHMHFTERCAEKYCSTQICGKNFIIRTCNKNQTHKWTRNMHNYYSFTAFFPLPRANRICPAFFILCEWKLRAKINGKKQELWKVFMKYWKHCVKLGVFRIKFRTKAYFDALESIFIQKWANSNIQFNLDDALLCVAINKSVICCGKWIFIACDSVLV